MLLCYVFHDILACDCLMETQREIHFPLQKISHSLGQLELSTHNVQDCLPGTGPSIPQDNICGAYTSVSDGYLCIPMADVVRVPLRQNGPCCHVIGRP